MFADWTDRIAAGEVPPAPPRPQGIERNVVITEWDWADPKAYLHDEVSTDRRNPTVNANGLIYGSLELSADYLPVLDPVHNTIEPRAAHRARSGHAARRRPTCRSRRRTGAARRSGRAGTTSTTRCSTRRDACGSRPPCGRPTTRPSARRDRRIRRRSCSRSRESGRQLAMYDPKTKKLTHISTCFSTHHLMFAEDANDTLWTSGGGDGRRLAEHEDVRRDRRRGGVAGLDGAHPRHQRQRQARRVRGAEPADRPDEGHAHQRGASTPSRPRPTARSGDRSLGFPGGIVRLSARRAPARDRARGVYEPPWTTPNAPVAGLLAARHGHRPQRRRWAALASGHMASFDRRKCKGPLNGPTATGQHCPEGWTFYTEPLPQLKGVTESGSAEAQLLHLGRSVRRARTRQEHADQHRQRVGGRCSR